MLLRTVCLGQAPVAPIQQAALWQRGRGPLALRAPIGLHRGAAVVSNYYHERSSKLEALLL